VGVTAISLPRAPSWWLRSSLSLALAIATLAVALPAAFGSGVWGGGVDSQQFFSSQPPAKGLLASRQVRPVRGPTIP
jgi:hypothetical protein